MISSFLSDELSSQPFRFPTCLEQEYSELINDLQRELEGFGQQSYSLRDRSRESIAWQLDRLFPTHYFKSYYGLLQMETDAIQNKKDCHLLSWPSVSLIDVGCGSGAGSLAALAVLQKYQQYRVAHSAPAIPVEVLLVGVDPSPHMLDLYSRMCGAFGDSLKSELIQVESKTYEGKFPEDIRRVLRQYQPSNRHSVLVVLSNIIRALKELYERGESKALAKIKRLLTGKKHPYDKFGNAEGLAIESIIDEWNVDCISMLGVATTESSLKPYQWRDGLKNLLTGMKDVIEPHQLEIGGIEEAKVSFRNPRSCYWQRETNIRIYRNRRPFYYSYARVISRGHKDEEQWQEILDPKNLELAWARSRRYSLIDEVLPDECEIRLFDYYCQDRLLQLRNLMLMKEWNTLGVEHLLLFQTPKKPGQTRPKATTRFEEQILSAAIIQCLGTAVTHPKSFSHRLCTTPVEYLYEHWWSLYRRFLSETRKLAAKSKRVLRADIASFYQNIDQKMLLDIIDRELSPKGPTKEALRTVICRDFPSEHQRGEGLPQGHIGSGFWANLHLKQVDEAFEDLDGVGYARYADDMLFAIDPERTSASVVEKQLLKLLKVLHLEPSEDKTFPQNPEEYRKQTALDQEINELAKEVLRVRVKLFYLDKDYMRRYSDDRWEFVKTYRELLSTLDIHMSPGWLSRKIEQKSNQRRWVFGVQRLSFPPFPTSEKEIGEWKEAFENLNMDWMLRLSKARKRLAEFFSTARRVLDPDKKTDSFRRQIHTKRLKFAANRLCSLGLTPIAEEVTEEVINRPWLVKVHWVCRGLSSCGHYELLLEILKESESAYCRAHALRALGRHIGAPGVAEELWSAVSDNEAATCEKLKASEGILVGDYWENIDFDTCVSLIETEEDPYLRKNYVLILGQAFKEESRSYLEELQMENPSPVVTDAIQYLLSSGFSSLLPGQEPDILLDYYDQYYPDDESDDKSDESDPSWIPF
jgi:hypothetical protein